MTPRNPMDLIDHILETHHALLHRELPVLDAALNGTPDAMSTPWRTLSHLLRDHLMKEERILFPVIQQLVESGELVHCGVQGPINQMNHEHAIITALEATLRENIQLAGEHEEKLRMVLDDLAVHAALEEDELFPAAIARAHALGS